MHKILLLGIALALSGCASKQSFVPQVYRSDPVRFGPLNTADVQGPVAINNVQRSTESVLLGSQTNTDYFGSMWDLTQAVVINAERELAKRRIPIRADASRTLDIQVVKAEVDAGPLTADAVIEVEVVTGAGLNRRFRITNNSPGSVPRAYNGAAALAVIEILSDREILDYLAAR